MVFSVDDNVLMKSLYHFSGGLVQTFNYNFTVVYLLMTCAKKYKNWLMCVKAIASQT